MSEKRYLTIEEVVALPLLSSPKISDDGQKVAYVRQIVNWDENKYIRQTWVYERGLDKAVPLTTGLIESTEPAWSHDSTMLAFLSPAGDGEKKKQQIFVKLFATGDIYQVTFTEDGVNRFAWASGDRGLYYLAPAAEEEARKNRKEIYGDLEYVDVEYRRDCLFFLELDTGLAYARRAFGVPRDLRAEAFAKKDPASQLTSDKELHIVSFAVSPGGKQIALLAAPSPNLEDEDRLDLYLLDVETHSIRSLPTGRLLGQELVFAPDGKKICYTYHIAEAQWYNNLSLELFDLASGETRQPALQIDECVTPLRWTDRGLCIEWAQKTNKMLGLLTEDGVLTTLVGGDDCFAYTASITQAGDHYAYLKASSQEPVELYLDGERISAQYRIYEGKLRSRKQLVQWSSLDGTEIEGVLSLPVDFDPANQYPLLLVVHGGPTAASLTIPTMSKYYPIEAFVEKGFLVLEPNYRGSAGYGNEFRKLNYRDLGTGDYADIISGVDALIARGYVNPEQVGVMGWSQGGYISAFCATYSNRFKAISVGAGISNWVTYYVNTDVHQFTRMYLGTTPWDDPEIYRKTSPMTYIKSACTPTLIQHGDQDQRVPTPNAYELYQGLRDMGVEVELVIYKGMGHNSRIPGVARAIMKQNLIWFCHHLLGETMNGFYLEDSGRK